MEEMVVVWERKVDEIVLHKVRYLYPSVGHDFVRASLPRHLPFGDGT